MQAQQDSLTRSRVAELLKNADRCIKEGNLATAFEIVQKARSSDPNHLYAMAFEERINALMKMGGSNGGQKIHAKENDRKPQPVSKQGPVLKSVEEKKEPLHENGKKNEADVIPQPVPEKVGPIEPQELQPEEPRIVPGKKQEQRVDMSLQYISLAAGYWKAKEYNKALNEIARVYILDPLNESAAKLEKQIRFSMSEETAVTVPLNITDEGQQSGIMTDRSPRVNKENIHDPGIQKQQHEDTPSDADDTVDPLRMRSEIEERLFLEDNNRTTMIQREIQQYIDNINNLLAAHRYDEALNELSLIIILDPLNKDTEALEKKIIESQERHWQQQLRRYREQFENRQQKRKDLLSVIVKKVKEAEGLVSQHQYIAALRTVGSMTILNAVHRDMQYREREMLSSNILNNL